MLLRTHKYNNETVKVLNNKINPWPSFILSSLFFSKKMARLYYSNGWNQTIIHRQWVAITWLGTSDINTHDSFPTQCPHQWVSQQKEIIYKMPHAVTILRISSRSSYGQTACSQRDNFPNIFPRVERMPWTNDSLMPW